MTAVLARRPLLYTFTAASRACVPRHLPDSACSAANYWSVRAPVSAVAVSVIVHSYRAGHSTELPFQSCTLTTRLVFTTARHVWAAAVTAQQLDS